MHTDHRSIAASVQINPAVFHQRPLYGQVTIGRDHHSFCHGTPFPQAHALPGSPAVPSFEEQIIGITIPELFLGRLEGRKGHDCSGGVKGIAADLGCGGQVNLRRCVIPARAGNIDQPGIGRRGQDRPAVAILRRQAEIVQPGDLKIIDRQIKDKNRPLGRGRIPRRITHRVADQIAPGHRRIKGRIGNNPFSQVTVLQIVSGCARIGIGIPQGQAFDTAAEQGDDRRIIGRIRTARPAAASRQQKQQPAGQAEQPGRG